MKSLIDVKPIYEGWGRIWQSGVVASMDFEGGLIVSLSGNENFQPPVLWLDMPDNDDYVLPLPTLIALCDSAIAFLKTGRDVLIHCNEGKYRSTYIDVAVHMRLGMHFFDSFYLVKTQHPIADLRLGTRKQLSENQELCNK